MIHQSSLIIFDWLLSFLKYYYLPWLMIWGWKGEIFDILIYVGMHVGILSAASIYKLFPPWSESLLIKRQRMEGGRKKSNIFSELLQQKIPKCEMFEIQAACLNFPDKLPPLSLPASHLTSCPLQPPGLSWTLLLLPPVSCFLHPLCPTSQITGCGPAVKLRIYDLDHL